MPWWRLNLIFDTNSADSMSDTEIGIGMVRQCLSGIFWIRIEIRILIFVFSRRIFSITHSIIKFFRFFKVCKFFKICIFSFWTIFMPTEGKKSLYNKKNVEISARRSRLRDWDQDFVIFGIYYPHAASKSPASICRNPKNIRLGKKKYRMCDCWPPPLRKIAVSQRFLRELELLRTRHSAQLASDRRFACTRNRRFVRRWLC